MHIFCVCVYMYDLSYVFFIEDGHEFQLHASFQKGDF